jgi:hypothetical protein
MELDTVVRIWSWIQLSVYGAGYSCPYMELDTVVRIWSWIQLSVYGARYVQLSVYSCPYMELDIFVQYRQLDTVAPDAREKARFRGGG